MKSTKIVLGIGAGIAAYKTPELVRQLTARGADVIPVMTRAASQFVTATSLAAVSGNRVRDDLWDRDAEQSMGHIELARWADLLLIAPATANVIARMANGLADDLLTTVHLATTAPVVIAPAMNQQMWLHPATARNVRRLEKRGVRILGPDVGDQACGETGPGRMMEPEAIAAALDDADAELRTMSGLKVLVTAGPTREPIDPVRFISNSSSGRQGYAIAAAARAAGAEVTLISGPVALTCPEGVERISVTTAAQMKEAVMRTAPCSDVMFAVAAVADYRPADAVDRKIKKSERGHDPLTLRLIENDDIVGGVAALEKRPYVVGFAAETHNAIEYARQKRTRKHLDVIVVNDVSRAEIGFDTSDNEVTVIHDGGEFVLEKAAKEEIARKLVNAIALLRAKNGAG